MLCVLAEWLGVLAAHMHMNSETHGSWMAAPASSLQPVLRDKTFCLAARCLSGHVESHLVLSHVGYRVMAGFKFLFMLRRSCTGM